MRSSATKRNIKPRPQLASAVAVYVSDQTSLEIVGLTNRQYRDFLARHRDIPRVHVGQRVLVEVADFRRKTRELADAGDPSSRGEDGAPIVRGGGLRLANADDATDQGSPAQPETVDEVLAQLGKRVVR